MVRKTLTISILLTLMLRSVSAQLLAKWRMPENRLRFILTLSEDQESDGFFNWCYGGNPMLCNTRAMFAENITLADILKIKSQQEKGIFPEAIVLDSSLNIKFNVDLQVPAGDDNRLVPILSQYSLAYFNAGYRDYTKVAPGYSLSVVDERAHSFPASKDPLRQNADFDGKTFIFQGKMGFLANSIKYFTGAFVWDKTEIRGDKYLSFTVEDKSSIDSWRKSLLEIGIDAKPDSAAVDYIEIFKLGN